MGSHLLPIVQGRHLRLPRLRRDVGSVTLELWVMRGTCSWSALLLQISDEFSPLVAGCSGAMARLVWASLHLLSNY